MDEFKNAENTNASANPKVTELVGGHGMQTGLAVMDKPLDFKRTLRRLLKSLAVYKYLLILGFVLAVVGVVLIMQGPLIMADITNSIVDAVGALVSEGEMVFNAEWLAGIYSRLLELLMLFLLSALCGYFTGFIMATISQKVSLKMRSDINKKLSRLPVSYFDKHTHGDVMSRIANDIDTVGNTLNQSLPQVFTGVCTLIASAIMMFYIYVPLAPIVLIVLPLAFIGVAKIAKRSQKYFREQQNYLGQVVGFTEETYGGHGIVKAFSAEQKSVEKFSTINNRLYEASWKAQLMSGLLYPIINFLSNFGFVLAIVFGAFFVAIGSPMSFIARPFDIGMIFAYVQYTRQFTTPLNQTAQISAVIQSAVAAAERIFVFLEQDEEKDQGREKLPNKADICGEIEFRDVNFGYLEQKPVLKDFDFKIPQGAMVAIVGQTGSGKSTLAKLLMRFYDLTSGTITLDGVDITQYKKDDYRRAFSMVLQDTWLFNGTVLENIRYGNMLASDEEVKRAAELAGADSFISGLKDGYNTMLDEEGSNLSEGQKQLLSIARAVIKDSKILIFDEATSSIDTITESMVQEAVEKIRKDKTSIVIAHRLSTIIKSDIILVMEGGRLVEHGTHEELLKKQGLYSRMYGVQMCSVEGNFSE